MRRRGKNDRAATLSSTNPAKMDKDEKFESERAADWKSITTGVIYATLPKWLDVGIIGLLIFGGCCGNVSAVVRERRAYSTDDSLLIFISNRCLLWKRLSSQ
jgi:hypothetical protein